jgi:hypothetical protein
MDRPTIVFGLIAGTLSGIAGFRLLANFLARRLALLLHRLWSSGKVYEPLGYRIPKTIT